MKMFLMNNQKLAEYICTKIKSSKLKEIKNTLKHTRKNENEFLRECDLINIVASFENSKEANK